MGDALGNPIGVLVYRQHVGMQLFVGILADEQEIGGVCYVIWNRSVHLETVLDDRKVN